jgi:acetoin utilization deacetylase AcuC-like enzyme
VKIGFCSNPRFVEHQTGPGHPERPDRIRAIYAALHRANLISANPFPDFSIDLGKLHQFQNKLIELDFQPADTKWIAAIHPQRYIDHIRRTCEAGGGIIDQGDTPVCPASYEIALLAVGAVLRSCDAVMSGEVNRCFAAVRPPGHHAEPDRPMGFCLFSNLAIGAKYLQKHYGLKRIAIVDFDVHHGNGTQACFEHDAGVYFVSLHQHPYTLYPGSGHDWEIGTAAGRGYTLNIGFNPGSGDEEYLKVIEERVVPELEEYRPEILMISAGFDAHQDDPLAQIELSEEGFELMTHALSQLAERCCAGRIVSVLEGGYNLRALGRSVVRHLAGLGAVTI